MKAWSWTGLISAALVSSAGWVVAADGGDLVDGGEPPADGDAEPPTPAPPAQFPLVESQEYTHDGWYKFWRFRYQPSDWTSPRDFSRGRTYFRFEILELSEEAMLQFCYFQDRHVSEKHACSPQWTFREPGVYYRLQDNRNLWQRHVIDWTRELLDFMLIDNTSQGAANTRVRVSMFVVAAGNYLDPPEDWECPSDWNCGGEPGSEGEGGGSGGSSSGGSASSGGTSSGGAPTGGTLATGGRHALGGAAGSAPEEPLPEPEPTASAGGAPTAAPVAPRQEEGGCHVAALGGALGGAPGGAGVLGALLAAGLLRRRRR